MPSPYPTPDIRARRRYLNAAVKLSITDQASARSANLTPGSIYTVYADCEWYFRQGHSGADASTSYMLMQAYERVEEMYVSDNGATSEADSYVAGIASSGSSGTVWIVRVS